MAEEIVPRNQPGSRAISLAYLTVRGASPSQQIEFAARCGYSHVGLRFLPVVEGEALLDVAGSRERVRETQIALDAAGISVLDVEFFWIKSNTKVPEFERYFAAAEHLGAANLLVGVCDPDPSRLADHWLAFCELAASYRLRANLEFMPFPDMTTLNTYGETIDFLNSAPCGNAGITIDAIHFQRSESCIAEIRPEHHRYFAYAQLCDAAAGQFSPAEMQRQARSDRLPLGRGCVDLIGLLNALPADLPVGLEIPLGGEAQDWSALRKAQLAFDSARDLLGRLPEFAGAG